MFGNRNDLVTKNLLHQHKAVFLTQIVKNNDLKPPNPLYNLIFLMSFASQLYVLVYHSYVVLHYYIIRMSLVCIPMSSACHLYALLCHSYVTRMYSYVIRMSLVCGFTMNLKYIHTSISLSNLHNNLTTRKLIQNTRKNLSFPCRHEI